MKSLKLKQRNGIKIALCLIILSLFACESDSEENMQTTNADKSTEISMPESTNSITENDENLSTSDEESTDNDGLMTEAEQMLALVNQFRQELGVTPLTLNNALNSAAFKHSKDMNDNNYFDHKGRDGSSFSERTKRENYQGFPIGENIAIAGSVQQAFNLWRESDGHRRNMLNAGSNEMGLGKDGRYWTQIFGKK